MELLFLGTSASEGYPNAFCTCDNCQRSRELGGRNLRKLCSALIDHVLLIDLGPELMAAARDHQVALNSIEYCLQTHEHVDHLAPSHFRSRSIDCSVYGNPRLHWYASQNAIDLVSTRLTKMLPDGIQSSDAEARWNVSVHTIEPFQSLVVGPYHVTTVQANHAPETTAMLFVIERDGRTLFYATDTGVLPEDTWRFLRDRGVQFNLVVMDHTFGLADKGGTHLNSKLFIEQVDRMKHENLLFDDARVYATHIVHHSNPPHDELVAYAQLHGYYVAYDGLCVDI